MLDVIYAAIKAGGDVENDPEMLAFRDRFIDEAPTEFEGAMLMMIAILASPAEKQGAA